MYMASLMVSSEARSFKKPFEDELRNWILYLLNTALYRAVPKFVEFVNQPNREVTRRFSSEFVGSPKVRLENRSISMFSYRIH